jgi:hypothetical protein
VPTRSVETAVPACSRAGILIAVAGIVGLVADEDWSRSAADFLSLL